MNRQEMVLYIGWTAPSSVAADKLFVMPTADGSANYVLKTDGSLNTAFFDVTTLFTQTVFASLLTQTAANPGTIRIGGIRVCWGTAVFPAATSVSATFSTAFSSTPWIIIVSPHAAFAPYTTSYNTTTATFTAASSNYNT